MKMHSPSTKEQQVAFWIQSLRNNPSRVLVSNYCYNCFQTGNPKTKTLIVFPEELMSKGIIAIDKPLEEIEMLDVIKLYKKLKCN